MILSLLCACGDMQSTQSGNDQQVLSPQITTTAADVDIGSKGAAVIDLGKETSICRITDPGKHILTGSLKGRIEIHAEDQVIHLILAGVDVVAPDGPALVVRSAGKVILTLQVGTQNTLRDAPGYAQGEQADACIYSECDLTINGSGELKVSGYYKDAIHSKDVLKLLGGDVYAQSKRDGIRGNDGIVIHCRKLAVESERNGLYSTKTGKPAKGNIEVLGGDLSIIGGRYAICCAADLIVTDCQLHTIGVVSKYQVAGRTFFGTGGA